MHISHRPNAGLVAGMGAGRASLYPLTLSSPPQESHPIEAGQIVTIEPGYYKDHCFGIRIENVVEVVKVSGGGGGIFRTD